MEICLRMCANGANLGRFFANHNVAAVGALPYRVAVFREYQIALDVLEQLFVAFLMLFFNCCNAVKQRGNIVKAFLTRGFAKPAYISVHS